MQADPIFSFCAICLLDQKCDIPRDCIFQMALIRKKKFQQLYRETEIAIQNSPTHKSSKILANKHSMLVILLLTCSQEISYFFPN